MVVNKHFLTYNFLNLKKDLITKFIKLFKDLAQQAATVLNMDRERRERQIVVYSVCNGCCTGREGPRNTVLYTVVIIATVALICKFNFLTIHLNLLFLH